jgi:hypothetical protein
LIDLPRQALDIVVNRRGDLMKPEVPARDWRRIHHSPLFWIGVVLCLSAIMIYVLSDDLAWRPASSVR